jgi:hypothetical protein
MLRLLPTPALDLALYSPEHSQVALSRHLLEEVAD